MGALATEKGGNEERGWRSSAMAKVARHQRSHSGGWGLVAEASHGQEGDDFEANAGDVYDP